MRNLYSGLYLVVVVLFMTSCSKPTASFVVKQEDRTAPAKVTFTNNSKNATTYRWDFGDGNSSEYESPIHRYLHSGNYEVTLIATDEKGKTNIKKSRLMVVPPKNCLVEIQTDYGSMVVELYDETPKHRDNFIKLVEEGFYNDLLFHRVINGFMIQGGDPNSKNPSPTQQLGAGGPGYQIDAEFSTDFIHTKGALAAARQGDAVNPERKSSGSQFYIVQGKPLTEQEVTGMERRTGMSYSEDQKNALMTHGGTPFLDGQYTVFGHVVTGLEVIDKIAEVETQPGDRPKVDVKMKIVSIK